MSQITELNLSQINAANGTYTVNDAIVASKNFTSIFIAEDTIITSIFLNGGSTNVVGDYIKVPGTAIKAGTIISIGTAKGFGSSIQLASGSVTLILK
mgnify:CR=1 FL=1